MQSEMKPMKRLSIIIFIVAFSTILYFNKSSFAVDYPVISIGVNGGYGQSELTKGFVARAFLRYSLEAYVPGLHIDASFAPSFYDVLDKTEILNPDPQSERRIIETCTRDFYPAVTGAFHLHPFGEMTTFYFGGGAQLHFLSVYRKTTDRYWDPVAEKYQETEMKRITILDQIKPGYHLIGGLRFALGKFGTFDFEVRQTFLEVNANDWDGSEARASWGEKRWNNLSVNLGMTIFIF